MWRFQYLKGSSRIKNKRIHNPIVPNSAYQYGTYATVSFSPSTLLKSQTHIYRQYTLLSLPCTKIPKYNLHKQYKLTTHFKSTQQPAVFHFIYIPNPNHHNSRPTQLNSTHNVRTRQHLPHQLQTRHRRNVLLRNPIPHRLHPRKLSSSSDMFCRAAEAL